MPQKRVFIIHGWDGYPEEGIFPWLKAELETRGFYVEAPAMPNQETPKIEAWVPHLARIVGEPDEHTYFFGHSIGAQTVLRYLEGLPEGKKIGGVVFLAGWVHLTDEAYETEEDPKIAAPWLETPLDWNKIKSHTDKFIAIFSDDDAVVPLGDSKIFKDKLGAEIIVEHKKDHFSGSSGIKKLPSALDALLGLTA